MRDNIDIFKKWIVYQLKDRHLPYTWHENALVFKRGKQTGEIVFYEHELIEEVIYEHDQVTFYLYYAFENYLYATKMFMAMMQAKESHEVTHVLICCSGGLTSAFFVTRMREYLQLNHIEMAIQAAAVNEIDEFIKDTDVILIAPQMRYCLTKISEKYPDQLVAAIPAAIFAAYDCHGLYLFIHDLLLRCDQKSKIVAKKGEKR